MDYRSVHVVYIHAESGTRRYPNCRDRNERKKGRKRGARCDSTEAARRPEFGSTIVLDQPKREGSRSVNPARGGPAIFRSNTPPR